MVNLTSLQEKFRVYPRLQIDIDFSHLIKSLLSFGQVININQTLDAIKSFWKVDDKEIIVTFSVRTAFDLFLQSLQLPAGSEVLMSAINIPEMVEIVELHGLIPVPVDISPLNCEPSLELLEKLVSDKTKIFLIAHIFGTIINLEPYIEFSQKYNLILIEDCAQAFAGNKYYGYPEVDASFFSFGPIKSSTALGGAVILLQDKLLAKKILERQQQYPKKSEFWFFIRVIKFLCLKILSNPWIYCHFLHLVQLFSKDVDSTIRATTRGFASGDLFSKIRHRPPHHLLCLLALRLSECEDFSQRIHTVEKFIKQLTNNLTIAGIKADYHSFWLLPIIIPQPELLVNKLQENNFDASRGSTSLVVKEPSCNKKDNISPENAKYLMEHIVFLPIHKTFPASELYRLAQSVDKFF
jgi:perosamine synthetase